MSDFSLTLVLQIKSSKIINDMAKISIKSEKMVLSTYSQNLLNNDVVVIYLNSAAL